MEKYRKVGSERKQQKISKIVKLVYISSTFAFLIVYYDLQKILCNSELSPYSLRILTCPTLTHVFLRIIMYFAIGKV